MCRRSRSLLLLVTFAVVIATGVFHAAAVGHYRFFSGPRLGWELTYAAMLAVAAYAAGLPDQAVSRTGALARAVPAIAVAATGISVVQLVLGSLLLPRLVVGGSALLLVPVSVAAAQLSLHERAARRRRERILVVADTADVATLTADLAGRAEHAASVVASAPLAAVEGRGTEQQPLVQLADRCSPTVVVLDRRTAANDSVVLQAAILHERGVRVRTLSLFYEEWLGKLPLGELERVSLMFDIGEVHRAGYVRVKRLLDVALGLVGTLAAGLALPLIVLVNVAANRGPLLFRQERVGKGGGTFTMLKFRTCQPGCGDTSWTLRDDPRLTRGGAWLRKLHLDELPNFFNVLRGDMTLVGPRPEQPRYVEELSGKLPFYRMRHLVRPGLTGWAQVNFGYASDLTGAMEKLQYDFYYLRRQGVAMDARVLGRTLRAVLRGGR